MMIPNRQSQPCIYHSERVVKRWSRLTDYSSYTDPSSAFGPGGKGADVAFIPNELELRMGERVRRGNGSSTGLEVVSIQQSTSTLPHGSDEARKGRGNTLQTNMRGWRVKGEVCVVTHNLDRRHCIYIHLYRVIMVFVDRSFVEEILGAME